MKKTMEDLIISLLDPLVQDIKKVKIETSRDGDSTRYTLSVPQKDIAKVIGKNGKMIKAIKNLVKIKSVKENVYSSIDLVEV